MHRSNSAPNWRCSWRVDSLDTDYSSGAFPKAERFLVPGQGGKAQQAAEIKCGTKLVKTFLGKYYKPKLHVVLRKDKFYTSPGPVYVKLKTKDELDPPQNPQQFSKYQRFVPSLQFTNQLKDDGFHKLTGLAEPIYSDSRYGYIKPRDTSKPRLLKAAARQPPFTYLGPGVHIANLERPSTVSDLSFKSSTLRFNNVTDTLRVQTPGPGHYRRPADSCAVHNPHRRSIPFCKPVSRIFPRTRRRGEDQVPQQEENQLEHQSEQQLLVLPKKKKKYRPFKKKYTGGGNGVKFSSYVEPSMMFSSKARHLGPGCYSMSAQAALDLEPRQSPAVKFRPLPRQKKLEVSSRKKGRERSSWPRPLFKDPEGVCADNFEQHFWSLENQQNGREDDGGV